MIMRVVIVVFCTEQNGYDYQQSKNDTFHKHVLMNDELRSYLLGTDPYPNAKSRENNNIKASM